MEDATTISDPPSPALCAYVLGHDLCRTVDLMGLWWNRRNDFVEGTLPLDDKEDELYELSSNIQAATVELTSQSVIPRGKLVLVLTELARLDPAIFRLFDEIQLYAHDGLAGEVWEDDFPPGQPMLGAAMKALEASLTQEPLLKLWYDLGFLVSTDGQELNLGNEPFTSLLAVTEQLEGNVEPSRDDEKARLSADSRVTADTEWRSDEIWFHLLVKALKIGANRSVLRHLDAPFLEDGCFRINGIDSHIRHHLGEPSTPAMLLRIDESGVIFLDHWFERGAISEKRLDVLRALADKAGKWVSKAELTLRCGGDSPTNVNRLKQSLRPAVDAWLGSNRHRLRGIENCLIETRYKKGYRLALREAQVSVEQ